MKPESRLTRIREIIRLAEARSKAAAKSPVLCITPDEWNEIYQLTNAGKPNKNRQ